MKAEDTNTLGGPNCYVCKHRRNVPGDCHSSCANHAAKVTCHPHGRDSGWFWWPINFDPTWLISCTGFERNDT